MYAEQRSVVALTSLLELCGQDADIAKAEKQLLTRKLGESFTSVGLKKI